MVKKYLKKKKKIILVADKKLQIKKYRYLRNSFNY